MDVYEELYELRHNFDDLFSEYGKKCNAYRELEKENEKLKELLKE